MNETGYEDLDKLYTSQNQAFNDQKEIRDQIVDKQTDIQVNRMNQQKADYDKDATKEAKGLYADYKKASSAYGAEAEMRAEQGLNRSGYAESSQVNLYNNYQSNVTELITTTNKLKAQVDMSINEAYANADIQKAENQATLYEQQANLALSMYEYKQQRDQFEWQKETWQKEFDFNREQFEYQKQRDAVSDSQWERQYQMSLQSLR